MLSFFPSEASTPDAPAGGIETRSIIGDSDSISVITLEKNMTAERKD